MGKTPYTEIINPTIENSSIFCSNYERATKDWAVNPHLHRELELMYQVEGRKTILINEKAYELSAGDLILIGNNVPHSTRVYRDSLDFFIQFQANSERMADSNLQKYLLYCSGNVFVFKSGTDSCEAIRKRMDTIIEENQKKQFGYQSIIKSEVSEIILLLHRYHILQNKSTQIPEWMRTAISYIDQHYDEIQTLTEICQVANVTHTHLCRVFKQATEQTPIDYLNFVRVTHAETLLREDSMSITDIAFRTGFGSVAYFSKVFKRYKSYTPGEYRKLYTEN